MNKQELELIGKLNDPSTQDLIDGLRKLAPDESVLMEDNRTLAEIIQEVANEEGMSYEETLSLFKTGMKQAHASKTGGVSGKAKTKARKKKKMAKASKKRNR